MNKGLILMLSVLGILAIVVAVELFFYFKINQGQKLTTGPLPAPAEMSNNFDPSVDTPEFSIKSASPSANILNLQFIFPSSWKGKEAISEITCKQGDIKIDGQDASLDDIFAKIQSATDSSNMVFGGVCTDKSCSEIFKGCVLNTQ